MKKKASGHSRRNERDTMRREYDFSAAVRGVTAARYAQGANKEISMKLQSVPPYPITVLVKAIPTNLARNLTPEGRYQIVRVLKPGAPTEGDFEILFQGSKRECEDFLRRQVQKEFPGSV